MYAHGITSAIFIKIAQNVYICVYIYTYISVTCAPEVHYSTLVIPTRACFTSIPKVAPGHSRSLKPPGMLKTIELHRK